MHQLTTVSYFHIFVVPLARLLCYMASSSYICCYLNYPSRPISESRITQKLPLVKNTNLPVYNIKQTSTQSTVGGTLMYFSQNISYKTRSDLNICSTEEVESTIIEILIPNKPSYVVGLIYKHPTMKLQKFNNLFFELLSKLKN